MYEEMEVNIAKIISTLVLKIFQVLFIGWADKVKNMILKEGESDNTLLPIVFLKFFSCLFHYAHEYRLVYSYQNVHHVEERQ